MDKKAIKQVGIGIIATLFIVKFENGLIWNTAVSFVQRLWGYIYPRISSATAFFLKLSPYATGIVNGNDYTKWLMNMGTIATVISVIMYIRYAKDSKLNILWKLFYVVFFGYITWFANCFMCIFWRRIDSSKPVFAVVSIALFGILFWLAAYHVFFKSLMANDKIL